MDEHRWHPEVRQNPAPQISQALNPKPFTLGVAAIVVKATLAIPKKGALFGPKPYSGS